MNVFTASCQPIPVVGRGTVSGIPNCLHVPYLEKNLLSVPHLDSSLGWKVTTGGGKGIIQDYNDNTIMLGTLDRKIMLLYCGRRGAQAYGGAAA